MRDIRTGLLLVLVLTSGAVNAEPKPGDHSPPVFHHTPIPSAVQGDDVTISTQIEDESDVFAPMLWWRYAGADTFQSVDLVKKGDIFSATIPANQPLEYWLEAYDELGNGPARAGSPEKPFKIEITARPPIIKDGEPPATPQEVAPQPAVAVMPIPAAAPTIQTPPSTDSTAPSIAAPAEASSHSGAVVVVAPTGDSPSEPTGGPSIAVAPTAAPTEPTPAESGPSIAVAPTAAPTEPPSVGSGPSIAVAPTAAPTEPTVTPTPGTDTPEPAMAPSGRSSAIVVAPTETQPAPAVEHPAPAAEHKLDLNAPTHESSAAAAATTTEPPLGEVERAPPSPVYKRWWFWTATVVVVAAIVVPILYVAEKPAPIYEVVFPAKVQAQ